MSEILDNLDYYIRYQDFDHLKVALAATYIYHCLLTTDEEARHVWSKKLSLGNVLYLLPRYSPIINYASLIAGLVKTPGRHFSMETCKVTTIVETAFYHLSIVSSDAALTLCIYALAGGGKLWGAFLLFIYLGFTLSILGLFFARAALHVYESAATGNFYDLGYQCQREPRSVEFNNRTAVATGNLYFSWKVVMFVVAISMFLVRYRRQNNSLINSIRKDGGFYYLVTFALRLVGGVLSFTPTLWQVQEAFTRLDLFASPILATTLLLNLRKVENPKTRTVVSSIMFAGDTKSEKTYGSHPSSGLSEGETLRDSSRSGGQDVEMSSFTVDRSV